MNESISGAQLFSIDEAGRLLGRISPWTLRKHIAVGNVKVTRIGRRVFLTAEELRRIQREGLPSLGQFRKPNTDYTDGPPENSKTAGDSFPAEIHSGEAR